jgi:guanylate cyclase 2F
MVKNDIKVANVNSLTSSNQSSHSPSVTGGDSIEVKVEITPAPPTMMSDVTNSYSIESTSSLTICSDTSSKSQGQSPNPNNRKYSEMSHDSMTGFLNPMSNFTRMGPTSSSMNTSSSSRLFKKIEEMIDLSLPYNHYRCLSPSETNLSLPPVERCMSVSPNAKLMDAGKPGSSRLLRRQFSLDKDDLTTMQKHGNLETISSLIDNGRNPSSKSNYQPLISTASLPSGTASLTNTKIHKHQSASVAQDLEKIEEIPISPLNAQSSILSSNGSLNSFKNSNNSNNNSKTQSTKATTDTSEINLNIENLR